MQFPGSPVVRTQWFLPAVVQVLILGQELQSHKPGHSQGGKTSRRRWSLVFSNAKDDKPKTQGPVLYSMVVSNSHSI